jgi:radical SAM superfamily enzyme YgiQ (UPF0313 family)
VPTLLLITASAPEMRIVRRSRVLNFQQITMPYLAARVPSGWDVIHVDEHAEDIDWTVSADVVALTFHTPSAWHAYDVAARFRARGSCVVMGGPHVTLVPEEARQHADVIFIGEAEALWEEFLANFEAKSYRTIYRAAHAPSLDHAPMARQDLFHRQDGTSGVLFATRGCPSQCEFCTIAVMYPHRLRKRPLAEVVAEYASFKGKVIIFWDDNLAGDRQYAKDLFRAITPYRKWWSSQASLQAGRDDEFLEAAARSGCRQLFLGLESISQDSLVQANKRFNRVDEYVEIVERIHSHGIAVQAGIVFGFDYDGPQIFKATLDFMEAARVDNATFNILTPFPGTPLFRRLEREDRILTRDWRKYNGREDVVYQPKQMSGAELLAGFRYANERFYSVPSMVKRLVRSRAQWWWTVPLNMAYGYQWRKTARRALEHRRAADASPVAPGG